MTNAGAQKIRVLIVDDNAEMREQLDKLMSMEPDIEVVGKAIGGEEGVRMAIDLRPDIITMDINMEDIDGLQAAAKITAVHSRVGIIMLSVQHSAEYMRQAMRAGACDYLIKPPKPDELFNVIRHCYESIPEEEEAPPPVQLTTTTTTPGRDGHAIAVYGPKGGAGATTIATSVAVGLARRGASVAIVDADLQFGDIGIFLNQRSPNSLADLPAAAEELDAETVEIMMSIHEDSGMRVLLAPPRPEMAEYVRPGSLKSTLNILKSKYDFVVVDTGTVVNDELLAVFDATDRQLIVATPDIPALKNVTVFFELLDLLGYSTENTLFVLNRIRQGGITPEQVQGYLKRMVVGSIPEDIQFAVSSVNAGQALIDQDLKKCAAAKGLIELVKSLEAELAPETVEA